jgi:putative flippase GtrA
MRAKLVEHRELVKFTVVGGICFVITIGLWWLLKLTVLGAKPVTAQAIAIIVATIVSYTLSREWSFRTRGGRERRHEAALFFVISAVAVGLNLLPTICSRYLLHLETPYVSMLTQEAADFLFGAVIGTLLGTVFRYWAFRKFVFPEAGARDRSGRVSALRVADSARVTGDGEHEVA